LEGFRSIFQGIFSNETSVLNRKSDSNSLETRPSDFGSGSSEGHQRGIALRFHRHVSLGGAKADVTVKSEGSIEPLGIGRIKGALFAIYHWDRRALSSPSHRPSPHWGRCDGEDERADPFVEPERRMECPFLPTNSGEEPKSEGDFGCGFDLPFHLDVIGACNSDSWIVALKDIRQHWTGVQSPETRVQSRKSLVSRLLGNRPNHLSVREKRTWWNYCCL